VTPAAFHTLLEKVGSFLLHDDPSRTPRFSIQSLCRASSTTFISKSATNVLAQCDKFELLLITAHTEYEPGDKYVIGGGAGSDF
jgi:hypothetical protein